MTGWKITMFDRGYIFIHGYFSIVMLVFGGVSPCSLEAPKEQRLCTPSDAVGAEKGEKGTKSSNRFVGFGGIRRGEQQKHIKSIVHLG